jgi:carboxypeptidase D
MDGLFLENGPLRFVTSDEDEVYLTDNPYSWNKAPAYALYIDQPVGTGLSFTTSRKYPTNDEEVNVDFYYFLTQFFALHADKFVTSNGDSQSSNTQRQVQRPVYFSGESHAGHYIPSMMHYILRQQSSTNNNLPSSSQLFHINLRGAAIGNGWTDPFYQYAAAEAAYGHGMLDRPQVNAFDELERQCQDALNHQNYAVSVCFELLDKVVAQSHGSNAKYKVSTYDARRTEQRGSPREFPPGHKIVETYLGNWPWPSSQPGHLAGWDARTSHDLVMEALHAKAAKAAGQQFQECTDPPYDALSSNDGKGVVPDVIAVLEHSDNVRLLFFNGMEDLICNHVGNELFLMNMKWSGQSEW